LAVTNYDALSRVIAWAFAKRYVSLSALSLKTITFAIHNVDIIYLFNERLSQFSRVNLQVHSHCVVS